MAEDERRCPACGAPVQPERGTCWNCGAALAPPEEPRRRFRIVGGVVLPGIYLPIGRQTTSLRRWGWLLALLFLLFLLAPVLVALFFNLAGR